MTRYFYLIFLFFVLGCAENNRSLKLVKVVEIGGAKMTDQPIVDLLNIEKGLDLSLEFSSSPDSVIDALNQGKTDLAILPNNLFDSTGSIQTVTALLPRIMIVLYRDRLGEPKSIEELLNGRNIGHEPIGQRDYEFFADLLNHFKVDINRDINPILIAPDNRVQMDSIDVFVFLTHLKNDLVGDLLTKGLKMFSLDEPEMYGRGSAIEGFCLTHPRSYPFLLPKFAYAGVPENPVSTIAVRDIMVCRRSLSQEITYDIIQAITENKTWLTQHNNSYGLLNLDYNSTNSTFAFPLHQGSINYLNKDSPSFIERYAEVIGVLFSIMVVLFGLIPQIGYQLKRKKKNRIDHYYKKLLNIRKAFIAGNLSSHQVSQQLISIRENAFDELIDEQLLADDSFNIFLGLYEDIMKELQD